MCIFRAGVDWSFLTKNSLFTFTLATRIFFWLIISWVKESSLTNQNLLKKLHTFKYDILWNRKPSEKKYPILEPRPKVPSLEYVIVFNVSFLE